MNLLLPNFDFSLWITEFYILLKRLDDDFVDVSTETEKLKELIEGFEHQIHYECNDESMCNACAFMVLLNKFNKFMSFYSRNSNIEDVIGFFAIDKYQVATLLDTQLRDDDYKVLLYDKKVSVFNSIKLNYIKSFVRIISL